MHAVGVKVIINDSKAAESHLREMTVPRVSQAQALSPATGRARTTPACQWSSSTQRTQRIPPKSNCRQ